jgi:CRISPR-associated protein Cas1
MEFSKGTLHYLKKNTEVDKSFTLTAHVREKLEICENYIQALIKTNV